MNSKLKLLLSAAVLSVSLGTTGCVVHDRAGYGHYRSGYYAPTVHVRGSHSRRGDDYRRHDRRHRDRYDNDKVCWHDGRRYSCRDDRDRSYYR